MTGYASFLGGGGNPFGGWANQALDNKKGLGGTTAYGKTMEDVGVPSGLRGVGMSGRDALISGLAGDFLNKGGLVGKFAGDSSGFLKNFLYNPHQGILGAVTGGQKEDTGFGVLGNSLGGIVS